MVKKLFAEIIFLVAAVALVIFMLEMRYRGFETPVDKMMKQFDKQKSKAVILLLGNSHMLPLVKYLDTSTSKTHFASLAFGGIDVFWTSILTERNLWQLPNVKTVVFSIDEEMMGYNQAFFHQDQINRSFYRYVDTLYKPTTLDKILAKSNFFRANRNISYLFTGTNDSDMKDWLPDIPVKSPSACISRAREYSIHRFDSSLLEENSKLLSELTIELKRAGKKIVFITMPKADCFLNFRSKENVNKGAYCLDTICKNNQVEWINFCVSSYPDSTFRDFDHLNYFGAKMIWDNLERMILK